MAKKRGAVEGTNVPKSRLTPEQVHEKVDEGVSNVIPYYCFYYGDLKSRPPVEPKVCHKVDEETFCCSVYTGEHTSPEKKCRFSGYDDDGQPQVTLGCSFAPYEEFERLRKAWEARGAKINPLKAAKRARKMGG